ncbi:unnamed protein product [Darwinula stevensoni]|uniref:ATP-dependent DNA helicase 2 subunit 1 n=1 Tax=Darwinula stevensoni TaxID=69355 RepID=A0A7R9A1W7_9CRUS|nr:unnamed protein product [Darwinula stevensoni]CAG0884455.1 unnamed protein product [Darwinula stevensoni]
MQLSQILGDEDDGEQGEEEVTKLYGRDGLVFLLDATASMFEPLLSGADEAIKQCLECVKRTLMNKIISSDSDLVGVVLFGTEKSKNIYNFEHVLVLVDLSCPSADSIKKVESFLDVKKLANEFGHSQAFLLSDALWICQHMFNNSKMKFATRRVMIFTRNDDPHASDPQKQRQARMRAEDLRESGIHIELLALGKGFNHSQFYNTIVQEPEDQQYAHAQISERLEELLSQIKRRIHKKRIVSHLRFELGPQLKMAVTNYMLARRMRKPGPVKLERETNHELRTRTVSFLEDTGEFLLPSDVVKFQEYGGRRIKFSRDDARHMKEVMPPGIRLVGFRPKADLKAEHYVHPASFIYPDEETVKGSTCLFRALMNQCIAKDVVAICWFVPRKGVSARLVALIPQEEVCNPQGIQQIPPGFHVIPLPFANDLREVPPERRSTEDDGMHTEEIEDMVEAAKMMIKKLRFRFNPDDFEDPVLQTHWRNIEALALNRDSVESINDLTVPVVEDMDHRAGEQMEEFQKLTNPAGIDFVRAAAFKKGATKRKAGETSSNQPAKRPVSSDEVQEAVRHGHVEKMTVAQLKDFLISEGVKVDSHLRKADLIACLYKHLGIQPIP